MKKPWERKTLPVLTSSSRVVALHHICHGNATVHEQTLPCTNTIFPVFVIGQTHAMINRYDQDHPLPILISHSFHSTMTDGF